MLLCIIVGAIATAVCVRKRARILYTISNERTSIPSLPTNLKYKQQCAKVFILFSTIISCYNQTTLRLVSNEDEILNGHH